MIDNIYRNRFLLWVAHSYILTGSIHIQILSIVAQSNSLSLSLYIYTHTHKPIIRGYVVSVYKTPLSA